MNLAEIKCIVRGKVQMVMFRDFVTRHARHLALTGYVRNTPDYTVEVVAQGHRNNLETLIAHLNKGPFLSRVARVDVDWYEPTDIYGSFTIRYD